MLHDGRPVARTDANGRALVTGLRPYEVNRISLDADALPLDAELGSVVTAVTPPARSGIVATLGVARTRAATLRIVDANGVPLPAGSWLRMSGGGRSFPVGRDGLAYVSGFGERDRLELQGPGARCTVDVQWPADAGEWPDLGTLRCAS